MLARISKTSLYVAAFLLVILSNGSQPIESSGNLSQAAPQFKFPWPAGLWEYRQGWHDVGNTALDIGTRGANADKRVLAAADGVITGMCLGNKSARVVINHNGTTLEYWHFDVTRLAPGIAVNQPVVQGQVLGVLLSGEWTRDQDGPNRCGHAPGQLPDSAHLHWVIPGTGAFTADGWTIQRSNSTWTRGSQTRNPHACEQCPYEFLESTNSPSARIDVLKAGEGVGTVTSHPSGINCGIDCQNGYPLGSSVTLIASASAGSALLGWSGDCTGSTSTCVVSVNGNKSVSATFRSNATFELRTSRTGNGTGTITAPGIDCGSDCRENYSSGTAVALQATADAGSAYTGWSGDCSGTSPCNLTMFSSKSVTATFKRPAAGKFILTVSKDGNGRGWVDGFGIGCGLTCTQEFAAGTQTNLRASPELGSTFAGWGGVCSGTSENCLITMDASKTVNATFNAINNPISKANLVSPSGLIDSRTPEFVWTKHDFLTSYRLEVALASKPTNLVVNAGPFSSNTLCSTENSLCSLVSPKVLANGTYVWRVHATSQVDSTTSPSMSDDLSFKLVGAPCTYSITLTSPTEYGVRGGTGSLTITTQPHCWWITDSSHWWISTSPGSGQGSGRIDYEVKGNCTPGARSGHVWIQGLESSGMTLPITQSRNPTFSVSQFNPSTGFYHVDSGQWKAGDFNGDGKEDLVHLTNSSYMHPWISRGDGNFDVLQFNFPNEYNTQSGTWLTGDFDKDVRTDLAHVTDHNWVNFWFSNGDGKFTEKPWRGSPTYRNRPGQWLAGDFNGDGRTDLVHMLQATYMHTWLSRGDGTWDVGTFHPGDGRYAVYLGHFVPGDFNGDGRTDLIHFTGTYIHTWLSNGDGRFTVLSAFTPWAGYNFSMGAGLANWQTGDFDGDGDTDLVHITGSHYVHSWISKGNGEFDVKFFSPGAYGTDLGGWIAGDYDADGKTDLLHMVSWYAHPWLSRGSATFSLSTFCPAIRGYNSKSGRWITADLNGDRKTDLVHLVADTYVHPWISGADETSYVPFGDNLFWKGFGAPGVDSCAECAVPPNVKVWVNTASGLYHCRGQHRYGKTIRGMYMTQKQARDIGFRAAYNRICR